MANIEPYLSAISIGSQVSDITGDLSDAFKGGAYAAWIQSITGEMPTVIRIGSENRVRIILNSRQVQRMQQWLDQQVGKLTAKDKEPATIEYELGQVFKPWAFKYAVPAGLAFFVAGWLLSWYVVK